MEKIKYYIVNFLKSDYTYLALVLLFYSLVYLNIDISGTMYRYIYLAMIYPYWRTMRMIALKIRKHPSYLFRVLWLPVFIWLFLFFLYATVYFMFSGMTQ